MMSYFYIIVNKLNGKRYYGSGSKTNYFGSGLALRNAIEKYGIENFELTVLRWFETREDAFYFEDRFLKLYRISSLPNTYNLKDSGKGGDTLSNNPNKESIRIKMSVSAKASSYLKDKTYEEAHGEEKAKSIRERLSLSHTGATQTEETKEKRKKSLEKKWSDPEQKTKWLEKNIFINDNPSKRPEIRHKMSIERIGENNPNAKSIEIDGVVYSTIIEASKKLGISRSTIQRKLKKNENYKLIN